MPIQLELQAQPVQIMHVQEQKIIQLHNLALAHLLDIIILLHAATDLALVQSNILQQEAVVALM